MAGAGGWERASYPREYQIARMTGTERVRAEHLILSPPRAGVLSTSSVLPEVPLVKE